jgi:hypothetical protein
MENMSDETVGRVRDRLRMLSRMVTLELELELDMIYEKQIGNKNQKKEMLKINRQYVKAI